LWAERLGTILKTEKMKTIKNKNIFFFILFAVLSFFSCREKEWKDTRAPETITIKFNHDTTITIYDNQTYVLNASTGNSSSIYSWGGSTQIVNVPGLYTINIQTDTVHATYTAWFSSGETVLFYPNSFSPNGDGYNDFWCPRGTEINLDGYLVKIYDSQQHLLFKTDQFSYIDGWDGKAGGNECPAGTYYYVVKYKTFQGIKHKDSGMLQLIR
jgi:gliding motility-associated-like protein